MPRNGSKGPGKEEPAKTKGSIPAKRPVSNKTVPPAKKSGKSNTGGRADESGTKSRAIEKIYVASSSSCLVTFRLSRKAVGEGRTVALAGDFTEWAEGAVPMQRLRNGDYKLTVELPSNAEYRFRYLIDGNRWENDWSADAYVRNPYGSDDSVVAV